MVFPKSKKKRKCFTEIVGRKRGSTDWKRCRVFRKPVTCYTCVSLWPFVSTYMYIYIDSEVAIRLSVRRHFKRFSYEFFLERYERTHYGFTACRIWQQSFVFGKYIYCWHQRKVSILQCNCDINIPIASMENFAHISLGFVFFDYLANIQQL